MSWSHNTTLCVCNISMCGCLRHCIGHMTLLYVCNTSRSGCFLQCIGHITLLYVCKTSMCGCFMALYLSHNTTMCITLLGVSVYCVVLVTLEMRNHKPLPIMGQLFELCQRFYQPYCILLKMKCHWFTLRHLPTFYLQMNIFVIRNASKYAKK